MINHKHNLSLIRISIDICRCPKYQYFSRFSQISQKINVISEVWTLNRLIITDCFSIVQVSVKNPSAEKKKCAVWGSCLACSQEISFVDLQSSFSFGVTSIEHDPLADDADNRKFPLESFVCWKVINGMYFVGNLSAVWRIP